MKDLIVSIDYKDWFMNQKRLPLKDSVEHSAFYAFHKDICLNGCMMNGTFINPFLYWHLNIWHTEVDYVDERGRISQKYANPLLRDNEWIVTNEIERAHKERKGLAILGIRRFAKALQNDELLYTKEGIKKIGDAKIGEQIYDHTGSLTTITGVYPQGKIPVYQISLEDGREIICCENHIWRVLDRRNSRLIKDLSIRELLPVYKNNRIHNGYKNKVTRNTEECYFAIIKNEAIQYSKTEQIIDPYYLGLWLGDGSSRRMGITTIDKEIKDYIYNYADQLNLKVREDGDEYVITSGIQGGRRDNNTLFNYFKEYNLIQNKHIPNQYLFGSIEQRIELLKGLMDTDGSVYKNGTISFTTTSEQLAIGFFQLCRSLGINLTRKQFIPKLYGRACGIGWMFTIFTEEPIFKLQRKLDKYKIGNKGKQSKINYTSIRNIELIGEDYATCITVDNNDKLFLTTDYTVTHNSVLEASYIGWGATFDENSQNIIAGLNAPDIKLITDKLDKGLNFLPEAWRWQRVEDDWKKQVTLGIKTRAGERIPFSQILIRNLDEGNNEEAIAGTKPRKLIIDEIGKGSFLRGFQAAVPGFTTPYGWGCSPIVTGCVCAGTKVWNNNGDLVNIEDLKKEDGIIGYDGKSFSKEEITYWQPPKETDCFRIETNKGTFLECSHDHPILYRSRNKRYMVPISKGMRKGYRKIYFKETKHLKIGDQIALIEEVPIYGTKKMWEPRMVGWLIGGGSYGHDKTPVLSNCDKYINDYIAYNFDTTIEKTYITKDGREYRETRIKGICQNLRILGIYKQTKNKKTLPIDIQSYNKKDVCELLGGFFDIDGCVSYNEKTPPSIFLACANNNILFEVKLLLQKLGVHSNITFYKPNLNNPKDRNGYYRLNIIDRKSIQKFYENITFKLYYKQINLEKVIKLLETRKNKIPIETEGLRFERIIKIESVGKKLVYNLTAGTTNTYIANGIVTHNTGGDMKRFMDAKSLMFDVESFNFLTYQNEKDDKRVHGLFINNKFRMEAKEESSLGEYLGVAEKSPLRKIPMLVSNEELANKILHDNLERLKKGSDRLPYLKEKMYYPIEVDDIFLNEDTNIFDIEAAKRQKTKLLAQERTGVPVILFHDGEKINHEFTDKMPISNFPLKNSDMKDAPVVIYEFPMENPPYGLYVAGVDPYRQGQSAYSDSLGSVYIYKRMHALTGEKYQDMFVASYCARPAKKDTWEEQARLLIKYYNARALCENDDISFIEYMKAKGDARFLEKQPTWLMEIVPNTTVKRDYGVHRSAQKIIDYLHNCLKKYMEDTIYQEKDDKGVIVRELYGISKILDTMLLEEIIQYNDQGNFDRIVAAELAIAQAIKMDPIMGKVGGSDDVRVTALYKGKHKPTLFPQSRGMFPSKKHKLFS